ncbi:hypothetical protein [Photobacterium alginatilyticum]|nr:hypothetical protein [Photobacterium alginatilyticum]
MVYPTDKALSLKPQLLNIVADWNDTLTQGITEEEIELRNKSRNIAIQ